MNKERLLSLITVITIKTIATYRATNEKTRKSATKARKEEVIAIRTLCNFLGVDVTNEEIEYYLP